MSDNVNRIIQKARIGEERAERLLEEMAVMQKQIDRLTRELAEARDKALEEGAWTVESFYTPEDDEAALLVQVAAAIRALKEKP